MKRHVARRLLNKLSPPPLCRFSAGVPGGKELDIRAGGGASIPQASELGRTTSRLSSSQRPLGIIRQHLLSRGSPLLYFREEYSTIQPQTPQSGGIIEIPLAQTGEGIADCELLRWHISEGDEVAEFQPLCSVQSDKAAIEITSRYQGKVSRLNFMPGEIVKVGETLLELICGSEILESSAKGSVNATVTEGSNREVLATPAVRNLAREYGIKLEDVSGSGKDGRVLKEDLLKHLTNKEGLNQELTMISDIAPKPEVTAKTDKHEEAQQPEKRNVLHGMEKTPTEDKIIQVRGYQRAMVKAMTAAAAIPHFYLVDDLNVELLAKLKRNLKDSFVEEGVKITYLPYMIKALSVALVKYPLVNSTCNEDASEICCKGSHNIGVAVATPHGLAVPNIKNVQCLSVLEIAKELSRLTQLAATNQLSTSDVSGGTITVTNFGSIGGKIGYPILNIPEVVIIAIGRIQKAPHFHDDGTMTPVLTMNVTWGADHRVLDGATIANVCKEWKVLVEHPDRMVMHLK